MGIAIGSGMEHCMKGQPGRIRCSIAYRGVFVAAWVSFLGTLSICAEAGEASDAVQLFALPRTPAAVGVGPSGSRNSGLAARGPASFQDPRNNNVTVGGPRAPLPDQLLVRASSSSSGSSSASRPQIVPGGSATRRELSTTAREPLVNLCSDNQTIPSLGNRHAATGSGVALVSDEALEPAPDAALRAGTSQAVDPGYDLDPVADGGGLPGDEEPAVPPPADTAVDVPAEIARPPRMLPALPEVPMKSQAEKAAPAEGEGAVGSDPCACDGGSLPAAAGTAAPWKLIDGPCLRAWGISVGGWLEQGITFNAQEPASRYNGPVATNDRHADYQLNQVWAYVLRPTNTGGCGFDIGGRLDLVFGTDWRYGINRGLEDRINGVSQNYGLVIPQMYLEVAVNRLSVKMGHFAGILDYEAVPAILNPFYSHSYCYGYTVPQLVTGLLASYQLSEQIGLDAGFHRGWMMFEDNNDNLDFMGGIRWKSPSGRTQLTYAVSIGPQDDAGQQDRFVYSLVLRQKLGQKWEYILVHNLGWENDAVRWAQPAPADAEWYGINQYFIYTISPKLSAAVRVEWLRDDDGVRIAGVGNAVPGKGWSALPGFAGNFYELTLGLNWRPHPNCLLRPEVRWDWYDGSRNLQGQLPFDDGTSDHQFLCATDLIITF